MTHLIPHASPALDELLVELDHVDSSRLFGFRPGQIARGMRGSLRTMPSRGGGLSRLEELILQAHREELAALLMDAARLRMREESEVGRSVSRWGRTDGLVLLRPLPDRVPDPAAKDVPERIRRGLGNYGSLRAMLAEAPASYLAMLSCRVVSTCHRRAGLAMVLAFTGSPAAGLASFRELLKGRLGGVTYRWAVQNAAVCAWRLGNLRDALCWIAPIAASPRAGPSQRVDYLSLALRANDHTALMEAGDLLADGLDEGHPSFGDLVEGTRLLLNSHGGGVPRDALEKTRSYLKDVPEFARRFLSLTFFEQPQR